MKNAILPLLFVILLIFNASSFASDTSEPLVFSGIVNLHNQTRAEKDQPPLEWSASLANYAQEWVDHLADTENCKMVHRPDNQGERFQQFHGENLFWSSPIEYEDGTTDLELFTPKDVVKAWTIEEDFYDYKTNQCQDGKVCGHYTQIVWHETKQVGCALAVCGDESQLWACNYSPRGNYIGEWPY